MITALYSIGIAGLFQFMKTAVIVVGYISRKQFISRTTNKRRRARMFTATFKR